MGQHFAIFITNTNNLTMNTKSIYWQAPDGSLISDSDYSCLSAHQQSQCVLASTVQEEGEIEQVFDCVLTGTGQKVWKFFYTDQGGLNQHSGVYFKEADAIKGLADFNSHPAPLEEGKEAIEVLEWALNEGWQSINLNMKDGSTKQIWNSKWGKGQKTSKELYHLFKTKL